MSGLREAVRVLTGNVRVRDARLWIVGVIIRRGIVGRRHDGDEICLFVGALDGVSK